MTFFIIAKLDNYADNNTPYTISNNIDTLRQKLGSETSILNQWFKDNHFKMNPDKCHLMVTKHNEDVSLNVQGKIIKGSESVKLLGINIDNQLDFDDHVGNICIITWSGKSISILEF